jgi:two-component system chemotaxis sensor kinase CheA
VLRRVHTLKGNTALFGVESIAAYCHCLETRMSEDMTGPTIEEQHELTARWRAFAERIDALLGARGLRRLEVSDAEIDHVVAALRAAAPSAEIERMVVGWRLEAVGRRFERVAEQVQRLATRMGKQIAVQIDDRGVRLEPNRWSSFWTAFVHAVRNAVDHGIEGAEERAAAGKPALAQLSLTAAIEGGAMVIEISDDGRGVDWERVRELARVNGMLHATHEHLTSALFADGISTRDEVTEISGRGVGLSALRAAARAVGGTVTLVSAPNRGTTVRFSFPLDKLSEAERPRGRRTGQIHTIARA